MATQPVLLVSSFSMCLWDVGIHASIVARLWSTIGVYLSVRSSWKFADDPLAHSRFNHHFGQESPRLDRDQSIMGAHSTKDHWTFRLCTSLCFGLPEFQYSRLKKIYVDRQVDVNDFRTLISDCMEEWKSSLSSVSSLQHLFDYLFIY